MNKPILIASILTLLALLIHAFLGDKELKINENITKIDENLI